MPEWRWRTFPVFFAFVSGMLIAFIAVANSTELGLALFFVALFGVGYGVAHMFVRNIMVAGRLRRQRLAQQRQQQEAETEEELVYPEEEQQSGDGR